MSMTGVIDSRYVTTPDWMESAVAAVAAWQFQGIETVRIKRVESVRNLLRKDHGRSVFQRLRNRGAPVPAILPDRDDGVDRVLQSLAARPRGLRPAIHHLRLTGASTLPKATLPFRIRKRHGQLRPRSSNPVVNRYVTNTRWQAPNPGAEPEMRPELRRCRDGTGLLRHGKTALAQRKAVTGLRGKTGDFPENPAIPMPCTKFDQTGPLRD